MKFIKITNHSITFLLVFYSLSNGEDYITSVQLQKRMLEICNELSTSTPKDEIKNGLSNGELIPEPSDDSETDDIDWTHRSIDRNKKLTEDNLVSAAVNYTHGHLPLVNQMLCLTEPNPNSLDHIPLMQRSIRHPLLAIWVIYMKIVRLFGRSYASIVGRTDFYVLLLLVYSLVSVENVFLFLPMLLYYVSLVAMILTTFQALQAMRDFRDFRVWSRLFLTYSGGSLDPEQAEYQFVKNNLKPYGKFFVALLVNLIVYPLIAKEWIPQSEIMILSFCFMFATLFTFMVKERRVPDWTVLLSFAVNVLAKYPYEIDSVVTQGWRFLDLKKPTIPSYVIGNAVEACLNFRLVFYSLIPMFCIALAARQKWRGTYKFFIPHCMTLSWLQLVIINSQGATVFGLLRATLALVGVVMFLPMLGVTTIVVPALAFAKWFATNITLFILIFVVSSVIGLIISLTLSRTRFSPLITVMQVIVAFIASYVLLSSYLTPQTSLDAKPPDISWETFHNFCHQPAWDKISTASSQLRCHRLENVPITWNGYVNDVKLRNVNNIYKNIIDRLPRYFHRILYCFFGQSGDVPCSADPSRPDCTLLDPATCTLHKHNRYEFEITTRMQSGIWGKSAEIVLISPHAFTNFTLQLQTNDKIYFKGVLMNNLDVGLDGYLGGTKPYVRLSEIGCLACHESALSFAKVEEPESSVTFAVKVVVNSLKFIFNILFNPVFSYK